MKTSASTLRSRPPGNSPRLTRAASPRIASMASGCQPAVSRKSRLVIEHHGEGAEQEVGFLDREGKRRQQPQNGGIGGGARQHSATEERLLHFRRRAGRGEPARA